MLIVLDRSGSMNSFAGCNTSPTCTRWNIARSSLSTMMNDNSGDIRFGLSTYPY
ncbi:MAG: VWA domain-containing protein, partial [Deltaproteobacteria bacterium]|nr:VWA domain-containing protein [Deltaproteobacteria bacterium]